jgi:hypothetical protein
MYAKPCADAQGMARGSRGIQKWTPTPSGPHAVHTKTPAHFKPCAVFFLATGARRGSYTQALWVFQAIPALHSVDPAIQSFNCRINIE